MQFTKPMIELVFEIRACVPPALKPAIKLANPNLFNELLNYYINGINITIKRKIEYLFSLTDEGNWSSILEELNTTKTADVVDLAAKRPQHGTRERDARTKHAYRGRKVYG